MKDYYFVLSIGHVLFMDELKEFECVEDAAYHAMALLEENHKNFVTTIAFVQLKHGEIVGHRYRIDKDG